MPSKKHQPEEIIGKLREVEIVPGQGGTTAEACRRIAVSERTYCRWRQEYGGLKTDQARRMKDLEKETLRLRRAISDLTFDKLILQEATGKLLSRARRRRCIDQLRRELPVSERRICRIPGQHRSTRRKIARCHAGRMTRRGGPTTSSRWPGSMGATVIAGWRHCCAMRGGR